MHWFMMKRKKDDNYTLIASNFSLMLLTKACGQTCNYTKNAVQISLS